VDLYSGNNPLGKKLVEEEELPSTFQRQYRGQLPGHDERQLIGNIKGTIGEVAEAATIGTAETIGAIATGIPLWAVGKLRGTGELLRGRSAKHARKVEEEIATSGVQPKTKAGKSAVGMVGKVMDIITWPARLAGQTATNLNYPRAGYLTELAGELATFKAIGTVKTKGAKAVRERATAKSVFDKKMGALTETQRAEVRKISEVKGVDLVKLEKQSKLTPLERSYETQKDVWLSKRHRRIFEADIESRLLKKELQSVSDKKMAPLYDEAIQIYIDLKNNPTHLKKYYNALNDNQKKVVKLSQKLPPEIRAVADKVVDSYRVIGNEAVDASVIRNMLDNYAGRQWDLGPGKSNRALSRFGTTTRHAKVRKLGTVLEGWAKGYDLKIKSATENLRMYKHEMTRTLSDKTFVDELRKVKDLNGNRLLSTQQLEGYVPVEHPNMTVWEWAGKVQKGKTYGRNFFADKDGNLFEKRRLFAPKREAKNLNNMLGISKFGETPVIKGLTKYNAIAKAWVLQTSLFHHMAFMRSNYLPMGFKGKGKTPRQTYRDGIKSIEQSDPVLMHGVEKGLTLGLKQDWQESLLRESTFVGRQLDKLKATKVTKDWINKLRESQADFLFGEFGAGLKAKSYLVEFRNQMKKYPNANPDVVAKRVANIINDDFGGLNLQRMGRNPTLQHFMQLTLLAPDWTESNIRTMVKAMKNMTGDQAELHMYRKFWGGVVVKGLGITALANYALSGGNIEEMKKRYAKAWKSGNFNWMKIDVTPIYEAFGGRSGQSKYFSAVGHFQDPLKFITHPVRSAKHKQSILSGHALEALSGTDYTGARRFTTLDELLLEGKTVKWGGSGAIDWDQFPAYALSQIAGTQPIQLQAFMGWVAGEDEGFDALSKSIGLRTTSTYKSKRRKKGIRKLRKLR
jgi:hypothetical protein